MVDRIEFKRNKPNYTTKTLIILIAIYLTLFLVNIIVKKIFSYVSITTSFSILLILNVIGIIDNRHPYIIIDNDILYIKEKLPFKYYKIIISGLLEIKIADTVISDQICPNAIRFVSENETYTMKSLDLSPKDIEKFFKIINDIIQSS